MKHKKNIAKMDWHAMWENNKNVEDLRKKCSDQGWRQNEVSLF
jgi:hypothetical protein